VSGPARSAQLSAISSEGATKRDPRHRHPKGTYKEEGTHGHTAKQDGEEHDLWYAVAIDGDSAPWERYGNHAWPAWYLIDKRGIIRHVHIGEGAYAETEREIEALLAEQKAELVRTGIVGAPTPRGVHHAFTRPPEGGTPNLAGPQHRRSGAAPLRGEPEPNR
jgi:hypothetical protein